MKAIPYRGQKNDPLIGDDFWGGELYAKACDILGRDYSGEVLLHADASWTVTHAAEEEGSRLAPQIARLMPAQEASQTATNTPFAAHTHPRRLSNILDDSPNPKTLYEPPSMQDAATFPVYFLAVPRRDLHVVVTSTHAFSIEPLAMASAHEYWQGLMQCFQQPTLAQRDQRLARSITERTECADVERIVKQTFPREMFDAVHPNNGHVPSFMTGLEGMKKYLDMHKQLFAVRIKAYSRETRALVHDSAPNDDDVV